MKAFFEAFSTVPVAVASSCSTWEEDAGSDSLAAEETAELTELPAWEETEELSPAVSLQPQNSPAQSRAARSRDKSFFVFFILVTALDFFAPAYYRKKGELWQVLVAAPPCFFQKS